MDGRARSKMLHIILTWGVGTLVLVSGYFRYLVTGIHLPLAFGPGLVIIVFGEYLRYRYFRNTRLGAE